MVIDQDYPPWRATSCQPCSGRSGASARARVIAARPPRSGPARQPLREGVNSHGLLRRAPSRRTGSLRRVLSGREPHHDLVRCSEWFADRLRNLPTRRHNGRARIVRRVLPRRGSAVARAGRQDPGPRHRRPPRRDRAIVGLGGHHRAHRSRRNPEHHVQRTRRPGSPVGGAGHPVRRPGGVERRHHRQRLDRRELPARRFSRSCAAVRAGRSVIRAARAIWDSWADDAIASSTASEFSSDPTAVRHLDRSTSQSRSHSTRRCRAAPRDIRSFSRPGIRRRAETSPRPCGCHLLPHGTQFDDALAFATDIRARRSQRAGRPTTSKSFRGRDRAGGEGVRGRGEGRWVLEGQYTGQTALSLVGQVWGRDLSDCDPDGPLPEFDPVPAPTRPPAARPGTARTRSPSRRSGVRSRRPRTCLCAKSPSKPQSAPASWARRSRSRTSGPVGTGRRDRRLQHLAVDGARRTRRDRQLAGAGTTGTRGVPDGVRVDDVARPSRAA